MKVVRASRGSDQIFGPAGIVVFGVGAFDGDRGALAQLLLGVTALFCVWFTYTVFASRMKYDAKSVTLQCWPWASTVDLTRPAMFQFLPRGKNPVVYVQDEDGNHVTIGTRRFKHIAFWGEPILEAADRLAAADPDQVDPEQLSAFRKSVGSDSPYVP